MFSNPVQASVAAESDCRTARSNRPGRTVASLLRRSLRFCSTEIDPAALRKSALVFSPHPDDECLGCGGIILKKKRAGATVKLVHMTDGSGSHAHLMPKPELKAIRRAEAEKAAAILGVDVTWFLDFEDSALSGHVTNAIERVVDILHREKPEEVFVPSHLEPARQAADHLATTDIVLRALAFYGGRVTVWEYPVWFWLHWPWVELKQRGCAAIKTRHVARNSTKLLGGLRAFTEFIYSVDVSDVLDDKIAALSEHRSQVAELIPHSNWTTLNQVSNGQFLDCFLAKHEFFHRSVHEGLSVGPVRNS